MMDTDLIVKMNLLYSRFFKSFLLFLCLTGLNIVYGQKTSSLKIVIAQSCSFSIEDIKANGRLKLFKEDTSYHAPTGEDNPMLETDHILDLGKEPILVDSLQSNIKYRLVYTPFNENIKASKIEFSLTRSESTLYLDCYFFNSFPPMLFDEVEEGKTIYLITNIGSTSNLGTPYEESSLEGCERIKIEKSGNNDYYASFNRSYDVLTSYGTTYPYCVCNSSSNTKFGNRIKLKRSAVKKILKFQSDIQKQSTELGKGGRHNILYSEYNEQIVKLLISNRLFTFLKEQIWTSE